MKKKIIFILLKKIFFNSKKNKLNKSKIKHKIFKNKIFK